MMAMERESSGRKAVTARPNNHIRHVSSHDTIKEKADPLCHHESGDTSNITMQHKLQILKIYHQNKSLHMALRMIL
jgi:hypothetical protein